MPRLILALAIISATLFGSGCALFKSNRVIFVDAKEDVVRLDDDVSGHVFVRMPDGQWVRSAKKVRLPAGWYAGYLPEKTK